MVAEQLPDNSELRVDVLRDRVFVNQGRVRNNRPPSPVVWQKVTSMNGDTGWINGSYIDPER